MDFVSFTENTGLTDILIDATGLQAGQKYTLSFESFDNNSNVKSALKTDVIEITIVEGIEEEIEEVIE